MKTIEISSLPIDKIMFELGLAFKKQGVNNCDGYKIKIPSAWGSGYIKGIAFAGGISFIEFMCKFYSDLEIKFVVNQIHPVKFLYCLMGNISHRFENISGSV